MAVEQEAKPPTDEVKPVEESSDEEEDAAPAQNGAGPLP
jgi:hypothetical protein